jgi:kynurenine formamidase
MNARRCFLLGSALAAALGVATPGDGADAGSKKTLAKADVEAMMKTLSNWGRWGENDQLGALNLITPEKRRQAAALVQEGLSVSLARTVIKEPLDASPAFVHRMTLPKEGEEIASAADEYSVSYHGFTQTHLDALCHLVYRGRMYNGFSQRELTQQGARKLGIERIKDGVVTRGVLMDLPRHLGVRYLEGKRAIYPEDLEAWEKKAGLKVGRGDAVLIRTGRWARREAAGPWDIMKDSAGLHVSCVPWLKQRDVAIVGSDLALDVLPSGVEGFELPVHWLCVIALGTPILDNCDFEKVSEVAQARKRWVFLLTAAPLAVEGGTGSPLNPLAIY